MDVNYNQQFNNALKSIDVANKPNLFLHVCCAPCSSGVLYRLLDYFNIYIIFYNSNIDTIQEFAKRLNELYKLISLKSYSLNVIYYKYDHSEFLEYVKGLEDELEGGKRCEKCIELRLKKSYDIAMKYINAHNLQSSSNYLCTTLSISPHKNADMIEEIGERICQTETLKYLPSDFKKEDGFLNSIKTSKELGLYRQDYCGCEFSKMHIL